MHQLIRLVVEAENPEDADNMADYLITEQLLEPRGYFDYGNTLTHESAHWRETHDPVVSCATPEGIAALAYAWRITAEHLDKELTEIRETLAEQTNAELLIDHELTRHKMHNVGLYGPGPLYYLYDTYGHTVRDQRDYSHLLKAVLDAPETHYVVFADVHY